jgi:NADPH:quinone reductase-like Zn-dependent oxidoreductase
LFSHGFGAFAERVVAPIAALALKPADLSFEQVATLPQAGVLAWQGLRDGRTTQPGDRILISGAGGGVGSFAIQLAVSMGAEVTAVDRVGKRAFIESLGASHFIDFEAQDYVNSDVRYDTIIDVQARRSVRAIRRVLAPSGRYGVVGGPFPRIMEAFVMGQVASRTGSQSIGVVVWRANDPEITTSLVDAIRDGSMRPAIGQVYPLEDAAQAFRHLASGTLHGKAVISVA